jgi:DNA-binding response OmpR family regulator
VPGLPPRIVALQKQAPYATVDDYVEKPFRAEDLRALVRRWS